MQGPPSQGLSGSVPVRSRVSPDGSTPSTTPPGEVTTTVKAEQGAPSALCRRYVGSGAGATCVDAFGQLPRFYDAKDGSEFTVITGFGAAPNPTGPKPLPGVDMKHVTVRGHAGTLVVLRNDPDKKSVGISLSWAEAQDVYVTITSSGPHPLTVDQVQRAAGSIEGRAVTAADISVRVASGTVKATQLAGLGFDQHTSMPWNLVVGRDSATGGVCTSIALELSSPAISSRKRFPAESSVSSAASTAPMQARRRR
jgi:hypothetical protein